MNVVGDPEDFFPYVMPSSMLKQAVQSDSDLLRVFDEVEGTGNKQRDFEILSKALNHRAIKC